MRQAAALPAPLIALTRVLPAWARLCAAAETIVRDGQVMAGTGAGSPLSAVAGGVYDPSVVTGIPAWREVRRLVARELAEPVSGAGLLVPARRSAMTWAARAQRAGVIVVKVRRGDGAYEKTQWCAAHLPALGARGYPVPAILWHGMISAEWHVTVQNRLPGRPLLAPGAALDGPLLDALLRLIELQADAGIPGGRQGLTSPPHGA